MRLMGGVQLALTSPCPVCGAAVPFGEWLVDVCSACWYGMAQDQRVRIIRASAEGRSTRAFRAAVAGVVDELRARPAAG